MQIQESVLASIPLFENLPRDELTRIAGQMQLRSYPRGEVVFREGEPGDSIFIIRSGLFEIFKSLGEQGERILAQRKPEDVIGEMSFFHRNGLRTASVRATQDASMWEITRADFDRLLQRQPLLAYEIARVLTMRLSSAFNVAMQDLKAQNRELERAYLELKAAQAQIIEKEKLERELQVAHDIQMGVLPADLPRMNGFSFGAHLTPARAVGGDFYNFVPLPDGKLAIMIGDVTDKGMPAALFMAQVHALLHAEAKRGLSPRTILSNVNANMQEMNAEGLFVTVLFGILDGQQRTFSYARAGHELPILIFPGEEPRTRPFAPGQPLGILDEPLIDEGSIQIPPGGTVLLYTDGVADELDPAGMAIGMKGLLELLAHLDNRNGQALCDHLYSQIVGFSAESPQDDDVTLVAISAQAAV